jgi:hypothetical protein
VVDNPDYQDEPLIRPMTDEERKNLPTTNAVVNRFLGRSLRDKTAVTNTLINAGFLEPERILATTKVIKPGNLTLYKMTAKAWRLIGNRPIWHTED